MKEIYPWKPNLGTLMRIQRFPVAKRNGAKTFIIMIYAKYLVKWHNFINILATLTKDAHLCTLFCNWEDTKNVFMSLFYLLVTKLCHLNVFQKAAYLFWKQHRACRKFFLKKEILSHWNITNSTFQLLLTFFQEFKFLFLSLLFIFFRFGFAGC